MLLRTSTYSRWVDSARHREYAEERLRELAPVYALFREWCGQEASEEFDQVLALREEVDRLRNLVQQTARWLKHNGHPVKAGLLSKELGQIPEADKSRRSSPGSSTSRPGV
jgi:hypothetical protein